MSSRASAYLSAWMTFLSVCGVLFAFWWKQVRGRWAPDGDEFALLANSARQFHPEPLSWFTRGYRDYLVVYPELTSPRSNFLRPVANLKYLLESFIFGEHWDRYLLTNYLLAAVLVAGIVWIGVRHLQLSRWQTVVVAGLCFLSPAYEIFVHVFPNACLDVLAAALLTLSLACFLGRRLLLSFVLVSLSILTKETAHFAPVAFSVCLLLSAPRPLSRKVKLYAALFPAPLALFYLWRRFAFSSQGGVYVFNDRPAGLAGLKFTLHGILRWPFHPYLFDSIGFPDGVFARSESFLLELASGIFWVLLFASARFLLKRRRRNGAGQTGQHATAGILLTFLAGTLIMPSLLNLPARFGALTFPLLILLGLYFSNSSAPRLQRMAWVAALVILGLTSLQARIGVFRQIPGAQKRWAMDRSYIQTARAAPRGTLLIVDDVSGFDAGTQWFERFIRYDGQVIRVSSLIEPEDRSCAQTSTIRFASHDRILIQFPDPRDCTWATLAAISRRPPRVWTRDLGGIVIRYFSDDKSRLRSVEITYSQDAQVSLMQADPAANRYRLVSIPDGTQSSPADESRRDAEVRTAAQQTRREAPSEQGVHRARFSIPR